MTTERVEDLSKNDQREVAKFQHYLSNRSQFEMAQYAKSLDREVLESEFCYNEKKRKELDQEVKDLKEDLNVKETGWGQEHEAWRYRHMEPSITEMGGFANYRYWIKYHAKNYFNTCDVLLKKLKLAKGFLENPFLSYKDDAKDLREFLKELESDEKISSMLKRLEEKVED